MAVWSTRDFLYKTQSVLDRPTTLLPKFDITFQFIINIFILKVINRLYYTIFSIPQLYLKKKTKFFLPKYVSYVEDEEKSHTLQKQQKGLGLFASTSVKLTVPKGLKTNLNY